jgi:transcriptional repressor NF-X1
MNSIFEPLACTCDRTVLQPPLPCGTPMPACRFPCSRPQQCAHPVSHTCHSTDECPLCPVLVERECSGGHGMFNTVPCHQRIVSCGRTCDKLLSCGDHRCPEPCHPGDCEDVITRAPAVKVPPRPSAAMWGELDPAEAAEAEEAQSRAAALSCGLACGKLRDCGHPCVAPCHPGQPCPMIACQHDVRVSCTCGNRTVVTKCLAGDANDVASYESTRQYGGLRLSGNSLSKIKPGGDLLVRRKNQGKGTEKEQKKRKEKK